MAGKAASLPGGTASAACITHAAMSIMMKITRPVFRKCGDSSADW